MLILGIETSCDDTAMAIVEAHGTKERPRFRIVSNVVSSQIKVHAQFGGVVPNLASREHAKNFVPVLRTTLDRARSTLHVTRNALLRKLDLIAVTNHPGLIPALLVGIHGARTLAWALNKPILGINHLEAHIYANWLMPVSVSSKFKFQSSKLFPALGLIVSGGHTQLALMRSHMKFRVIGETRDDAAGEAFDKVAKLLGLPFPGGPPIAALAAKLQITNYKLQITLPRPMMNSGDFDFSFSGLKTAVLYLVKERFTKNGKIILSPHEKAALCAEFQQAVVDVLISKTLSAAKKYRAKSVILGGGVGANTELRAQLALAIAQKLPGVQYIAPETTLATDNGAMIAAAAYFHHLAGERKTWRQIRIRI